MNFQQLIAVRAARLRAAALILAAALSLAPAAAQAQPQAEIDISKGGEYVTLPVAVPAFEHTGGEDFAQPGINLVVLNDLTLSGLFSPPGNAQFAEETNRLDQSNKQIHFAEWQRIGVKYLVKGVYEIAGGNVTADVRVYDIVTAAYSYGRHYSGYKKEDQRTLAHRISNDIVERLTGIEGIALSQIAFVRQFDAHGRTKKVSVMDADGFGPRTLTGENELTATPAWGAQTTELYYTTYKDFNPDLAGMILRTGQMWFVSRRDGFNLSPAWNEPQKLICLTLTKDGNSELYTINREGKNPRRLTVNRGIDSSPSWSPDGTRIAFTSDRSGGPQIYIMDYQSGQTERLTFSGSYNDSAAWSPKGDKIAYCSRIDGEFQIFVIGVDGSNPAQLTNGSNNEDPSWAPNGKVMAFASDRNGSKQVFSMLENGMNIRQLTTGQPCTSPAWSPSVPKGGATGSDLAK